MKIIIFGTGYFGKALYEKLSPANDIVAFTSNYIKENETELFGLPVLSPEKAISEYSFDAVVIASTTGAEDIFQQCRRLGVPENQIISSYAQAPMESRRIFLRNLADILDSYEKDADVAEAGVFQGEFAKWINQFFPNRVLHLFDTFQGFHPDEMLGDKRRSFSTAQSQSYYSDTSVDLVMGKMPYPEQCRVYKGYFPATAREVNSKFCFVNLDLDLYEPTYQGLCFFQHKMTEHGVILVHDYYSLYDAGEYKGVKAAVDRFLAEYSGDIQKYPIGDGYSIMLTGHWTAQ